MLTDDIDYEIYFNEFDMDFRFTGCAVRNRNLFVFLVEAFFTPEQAEEERENNWEPALRSKGIFTFLRDEQHWAGDFRQNWEPMLIGSSQKPANHSVSVEPFTMDVGNDYLRSYVTGSGPDHDEELYFFDKTKEGTDGGFLRGALNSLKTIDGWLYACGGNRSFGKRLGENSW